MTSRPSNVHAPERSDQGTLSERAAEAAEVGQQAGSDVAQSATEKVADVAAEAAAQTRGLIDRTRGELQDQAQQQHDVAADKLRQLRDELDRMSSGQTGLGATLVSEARDQVGALAQWLGERQPGDLVDELRQFGRQHPGTFLLTAGLAGVVAGRLTRATAEAASGQSGSRAQGTALYSPAQTSAAPTRPVDPTYDVGDTYAGDTYAGDTYAGDTYVGDYVGAYGDEVAEDDIVPWTEESSPDGLRP